MPAQRQSRPVLKASAATSKNDSSSGLLCNRRASAASRRFSQVISDQAVMMPPSPVLDSVICTQRPSDSGCWNGIAVADRCCSSRSSMNSARSSPATGNSSHAAAARRFSSNRRPGTMKFSTFG